MADVDPATLNISPEDIKRKITKRTKVIMPVHLGGYPCDMEAIMKIAKEHDIMVVEDGAHAFGSWYKGKAVGTIGDFGSFSFHEVKNITSCGEGGIVVTNSNYGKDLPKARFGGFDIANPIDKWLYDVVALEGKGNHFSMAGNHSSTEIQAVVLLNQLKRLPEIIKTRKKNAEYLNKRFAEIEEILPCPLDTKDIQSAYHLYLFQLDQSHLEGVQLKAKELSGYVAPGAAVKPVFRGRYQRDGYSVEMYALNGEGDCIIPLLLFVPKTGNKFSSVIYIHPKGKIADASVGGRIEQLVKKGYLVAAPDVSGTGETAGSGNVAMLIDLQYIMISDVSLIGSWMNGYPVGAKKLAVYSSCQYIWYISTPGIS